MQRVLAPRFDRRSAPPLRRLARLSAAVRALSRGSAPPLSAGIEQHVQSLVRRHAKLQQEMSSGDFSVARAREVARLAPIADAHARVQEGAAEVRGLRELADDVSSEAELRELARAELEEAEAALGVQQESLVALLVPVDDEEEAAAGRGALVELHPGVGGNEAATSAEVCSSARPVVDASCALVGWPLHRGAPPHVRALLQAQGLALLAAVPLCV